MARHPPVLACKWKNSWHECPKTYGVCYLIVIAAVSLATFVAFLMVFLLETALHEGMPLHLTRTFTSKWVFWGENYVCVDGELKENHRQKLGLVC